MTKGQNRTSRRSHFGFRYRPHPVVDSVRKNVVIARSAATRQSLSVRWSTKRRGKLLKQKPKFAASTEQPSRVTSNRYSTTQHANLMPIMSRQPAVYILTNRPNGTLYTGVTSDPPKRVWQHKNKNTKGFSAKYNLTLLVYYEFYGDMYGAITREKQIKAGSRQAKLTLISNANPGWRDLYSDICG